MKNFAAEAFFITVSCTSNMPPNDHTKMSFSDKIYLPVDTNFIIVRLHHSESQIKCIMKNNWKLMKTKSTTTGQPVTL